MKSAGTYLGTLELSARSDGDAYSAQDRRTLQEIADELAHLIGLLERVE